MAPPAQALLSSLIVNAVCGGSDDLSSGTNEDDEERKLENSGVEIIVNDGHCGPHAVYPHFNDEPDGDSLVSHAAYPVFYSFDHEPGGLIGDNMKIDAGIEIIASNGTCGHPSHVVYPHYGDEPEDGLLGAHSVYPSFEANGVGLLGEELSDDFIIKHDGIEIIASDGTDGHLRYPFFDSESEESGLVPNVMYPSYPTFEANAGEWLHSNGGSGANHNYARAVYPHFCDRPEGLHASHACYPAFGDDTGGLIGNKVVSKSPTEHCSVEMSVNNDEVETITHGGCTTNASHAVYYMYPNLGDEPNGLLGSLTEHYNTDLKLVEKLEVPPEKSAAAISVSTLNESLGHGNSKAPKVEVKGTDYIENTAALSPDPRPPDLPFYSTGEDKELATLFSVFFALPREELLNAMKVATSAASMGHSKHFGTPLHPCTGIGTSMAPLVVA